MKNIKVFTGEQDLKKAEQTANKILPLLKGMTINQIEMALNLSLRLSKSSMIVG